MNKVLHEPGIMQLVVGEVQGFQPSAPELCWEAGQPAADDRYGAEVLQLCCTRYLERDHVFDCQGVIFNKLFQRAHWSEIKEIQVVSNNHRIIHHKLHFRSKIQTGTEGRIRANITEICFGWPVSCNFVGKIK